MTTTDTQNPAPAHAQNEALIHQPTNPTIQLSNGGASNDGAIQPPATHHTRTGRVARLPKTIRDQINSMLQDGVPYAAIVERFTPEAPDLTEQNLTNWKGGGYLDWLRENQLAQAIQAKYELAHSIVERSGDDNAASQAVLQTIATNVCEFLIDTDPSTLRESLLSDADKFTRFVNAMVRLAEGGIKCEIHKFRAQDRATTVAKKSTSAADKPGISESSLRAAEEKLNLL